MGDRKRKPKHHDSLIESPLYKIFQFNKGFRIYIPPFPGASLAVGYKHVVLLAVLM